MIARRWAALAGIALAGAITGPYEMLLMNTTAAPTAKGTARLVFAPSPFGISLTRDGRTSYDVIVTVEGLPEPATLGAFTHYVAWAVTTDLKSWHMLGTVRNGTSTVGHAEMNKFLFVITAEAGAAPKKHAGPTILHGEAPSAWLQSFMSHPLFRGLPP